MILLLICKNYEECHVAFKILCQLLQNLGFTINWNKVVSPTQRLTFHGIDIDCNDQTLALPESRLSELKDLLQLWTQKHSHQRKASTFSRQAELGSKSEQRWSHLS